jgi:hypothetical protein
MSGTVYPVGPQQLKIPTTTLHPSASSPFNPSIINVPNEVNWNAIKALEDRGFYKVTFDACRPPYPAGGSFVNAGTYKLGGTIQFTNPGSDALKFTTAHGYSRTASSLAKSDPTVWNAGHTITPVKGYHSQLTNNVSATGRLVFDFELPSNCTVTRVAFRITPVVHGALPATMPKFEVYRIDAVAGTCVLIATETDSSILSVYNAIHVLDTTMAHAFDASNGRILIVFYGESGVGFAAGLLVHPPTIEFTRTQIGEEFGELLP